MSKSLLDIGDDLMKEIEESLLEIPKVGKLEDFSSKGLLSPFANSVSCSRSLMDAGKMNQYIEPINPEISNCGTVYEKDICRSSENKIASGDVEVLDVVKKIIGGKESCVKGVFYENKNTGKVSFYLSEGYKSMPEDAGIKFIDPNPGDKIPKGKAMRRTHAYDENMNYRAGLNATHIFMTGSPVLEDAVIVSKEFAERASFYKCFDVEMDFDPNSTVFKNLYGTKDIYKPFPMIGEFIKKNHKNEYTNSDGILMAYSNNASITSFVRSNVNLMKVGMDDTLKLLPSMSKVVDITIRQKHGEQCSSPFFKKFIEEQREFDISIWAKLKEYEDKLDTEAIDSLMFYQAIKDGYGFRRGKDYTPPNKILLDIKLVKKQSLTDGQKLTGNHGNKGVVGTVMGKYDDDDLDMIINDGKKKIPVVGYFTSKITDKDGNPIDYITAAPGVPNRANSGQLTMKTLNQMTTKFRLWMKENSKCYSDDEIVELFKIFTSIFDKWKTPNIVESKYKKYGKEFVEYIKNVQWKWRLLPFSHGITPKSFLIATKLFDRLGVKYDDGVKGALGKEWIYVDGKKAFLAEIGSFYVYVMKQDADKQMTVRTKGAYGQGGNISKTSAKKHYENRFRDTPIQHSTYDINLLLSVNDVDTVYNMLKKTDTSVIENLRAHLLGIGIDVEFSEKK